uniref:Holin n=1 Tax=viral metagenome TaxID=1070528 RepID=A0A6M3IH59_9ZZZZ
MTHLFTFFIIAGIALFITGAPVAGHLKSTHGVGLSIVEWVGIVSAAVGLSEKVVKLTIWLIKQGGKG